MLLGEILPSDRAQAPGRFERFEGDQLEDLFRVSGILIARLVTIAHTGPVQDYGDYASGTYGLDFVKTDIKGTGTAEDIGIVTVSELSSSGGSTIHVMATLAGWKPTERLEDGAHYTQMHINGQVDAAILRGVQGGAQLGTLELARCKNDPLSNKYQSMWRNLYTTQSGPTDVISYWGGQPLIDLIQKTSDRVAEITPTIPGR